MTVHCFNDLIELHRMLIGIQHYLNSTAFSVALYIMLAVLLVITFLRVREAKDMYSFFIAFIMPFVLVVALFRVTVNVNMQDEFSGEVANLTGLPVGIAFPLVISSQIEHSFLKIINDYITPPSTPAFEDVDFFGHARMMAEVSTTNLWSGSPVTMTTESYIENCVIPSLAASHITLEQIKNAPNMLNVVGTVSGAFFAQSYDIGTGTPTTKSCPQVYTDIVGSSTTAAVSTTDGSPYGNVSRLFGQRGLNAGLMSNSYTSILNSMFAGQQDSMEALFKQNMMINSFKGAMTKVSPDLLAAMSEAESKFYSNATVGALLYIKQLPVMRMMFKLVLIALFPVIGMFFIAQYAKPFLYWTGSLLWVSLWLPAEAAVHAAYATSTLRDLTSMIGTSGGYTYNNSLPILKWATETSAVAGGIMVIVPIITGFLLRWAFPAFGGALSGMLQASRGLGQAVTDGAKDSIKSSQVTVLGLEADKFRSSMLDLGDIHANARNTAANLISSHMNNPLSQWYGNTSPAAATMGTKIADYTGGQHVLSASRMASDTSINTQAENGSHSGSYNLSRDFSAGTSLGDGINSGQGQTATSDGGWSRNADMRRGESYNVNNGAGSRIIVGDNNSMNESTTSSVGSQTGISAHVQGSVSVSPGGGGGGGGGGGDGLAVTGGGSGGGGARVSPSLQGGLGVNSGVNASTVDSEGTDRSRYANSAQDASKGEQVTKDQSQSKGSSLRSGFTLANNASVNEKKSSDRDYRDRTSESMARGQSYSRSQNASHSNMAAKAFTSNDSVNLNELFGRMNFSSLHSTAVQLYAKDGESKYLDMMNRGYSNEQVATSMMQDFQKKWNEGNGEAVEKLFQHMTHGATQQGDFAHANLISRANEKLFGFSTYEEPAMSGVDSSFKYSPPTDFTSPDVGSSNASINEIKGDIEPPKKGDRPAPVTVLDADDVLKFNGIGVSGNTRVDNFAKGEFVNGLNSSAGMPLVINSIQKYSDPNHMYYRAMAKAPAETNQRSAMELQFTQDKSMSLPVSSREKHIDGQRDLIQSQRDQTLDGMNRLDKNIHDSNTILNAGDRLGNAIMGGDPKPGRNW